MKFFLKHGLKFVPISGFTMIQHKIRMPKSSNWDNNKKILIQNLYGNAKNQECQTISKKNKGLRLFHLETTVIKVAWYSYYTQLNGPKTVQK